MESIFEGSPELIKKTSKYNSEVKKIKHNLNSFYHVLIKNEKFFIKRLYLKFKCKVEINREIKKLTSPKNLYLNT